MSGPNALLDWWPIITAAAFAAAVYGGIRQDLANMSRSIDRAHKRLDAHIDMHAQAEKVKAGL